MGAPPATLTARGVSLSRGPITILDAVDLTVAPGHRIGIVGPNGVGKTTLLRVLAGQLVPDRGEVRLAPATATVGYLPQEPERRPGETAFELLARRTGVTAASVELDAAAPRWPRPTPEPTTATRPPSSAGSPSVVPTSTPAPERCGPTSVWTHRCSCNRW